MKSPHRRDQALADYIAGARLKDVAAKYQVSTAIISVWYRAAGKPARPKGGNSKLQQERDRIAQTHGHPSWDELIRTTDGESAADLAARLGCSAGTVYQHRKRILGHRRLPGPRPRRRVPSTVDPATVEQWRRELAAGATFREVAARARRHEKTVRAHVGPLCRPSGPRHLDLDPQMVRDMRAELGSARAVARELGVSLTTVRHRLWLLGEGPDPCTRGRPSPGMARFEQVSARPTHTIPVSLRQQLRHAHAAKDSNGLNALIISAVHAGWKRRQIAATLGISQQAVSYRISRAAHLDPAVLPAVPPPRRRSPKPVPAPRLTAGEWLAQHVTDSEIGELAQLWSQAREVRGCTPVDHPDRAAAAELDRRLSQLTSKGASMTALSQAIGASPATLRLRRTRRTRRTTS